ncbi:MAG: retroviral-like aspartic protease family protein [Nanoarchaeota archaeon]|nr:retroviral-like aspartic protease family protein [Nanoarchaeota archaeon]
MVKHKFNSEDPVIVLYVELEGKIKVRPKMALDTGATYTMIPWEIAEALGLKPELSKEKVDIITASGVEKAPLVILTSVSVLGKRVSNVKAVIHDLPPKSYVDGLLGLSFLKKFNINLNFKEGVLEIE